MQMATEIIIQVAPLSFNFGNLLLHALLRLLSKLRTIDLNYGSSLPLLSRAKSTHDKHESESKAKLASFQAPTAVEVAGFGVQSAAREVTRRQEAWGVVGQES